MYRGAIDTNMQNQLNNLLAPAIARLRLSAALSGAVRALLLGSIVALLLLPGRLIVGELISGWMIAAVPLLAGILGAIAGFSRGGDASLAARAVDRHYQLHDRLLSALEFSSRGSRNAFQQRQVDDALAATGRLDVRRAVALRPPHRAWIVGLLAIVVVAMCFMPVGAGDVGPDPAASAIHRTSIDALRREKRRLGERPSPGQAAALDDHRPSPARRHAVEEYFRSTAPGDENNR
jgi:hypothetical protein